MGEDIKQKTQQKEAKAAKAEEAKEKAKEELKAEKKLKGKADCDDDAAKKVVTTEAKQAADAVKIADENAKTKEKKIVNLQKTLKACTSTDCMLKNLRAQ